MLSRSEIVRWKRKSLKSKFPFRVFVVNQWPQNWPQIHWHNAQDGMSQIEIRSVKWFSITLVNLLCHISCCHTRAHTLNSQLNVTRRWFLVRQIFHFPCASHRNTTTKTSLTCISGTTLPLIYSKVTLSGGELISLHGFWIIAFSGTLVKHSIGCMRQESEIKRQRERGCKHRGNWIMPLVGGNELSFFSISFTICFYLVINESSVWWQQAGGCLLAAALSSHTACQTSPIFPLHTHMQTQPTMQKQHMHTTTCSYSRMYTFPGCSSESETCLSHSCSFSYS